MDVHPNLDQARTMLRSYASEVAYHEMIEPTKETEGPRGVRHERDRDV